MKMELPTTVIYQYAIIHSEKKRPRFTPSTNSTPPLLYLPLFRHGDALTGTLVNHAAFAVGLSLFCSIYMLNPYRHRSSILQGRVPPPQKIFVFLISKW